MADMGDEFGRLTEQQVTHFLSMMMMRKMNVFGTIRGDQSNLDPNSVEKGVDIEDDPGKVCIQNADSHEARDAIVEIIRDSGIACEPTLNNATDPPCPAIMFWQRDTQAIRSALASFEKLNVAKVDDATHKKQPDQKNNPKQRLDKVLDEMNESKEALATQEATQEVSRVSADISHDVQEIVR
jgi:hypothetical protein